MVIRTAHPDESISIAEITAEGLGYNCAPELIAKNIETLAPNHVQLIVAELDGEVVGFVQPQIYEAVYFEKLINILGLAVRSAHRGQGIGKNLMEAAETWARGSGAVGARLNVGVNRPGAHAFYRRIGKDQQ